MIVLDAFSSDAIPVHLLTREAVQGYLSRLAPHGVIVMHVSNRHMELPSVVAAVGSAEGLVAYYKRDDKANDFLKDFKAKAAVVVLAQSGGDGRPAVAARLEQARSDARWRRGPTITRTCCARSCARSWGRSALVSRAQRSTIAAALRGVDGGSKAAQW